ncbi:MAG: S-layer homology domain-containing protein [Oscillospiraceae bacterium]|nr:S-layer homology domain-containing protein [Oscillospiraceae bacterium]
MNSLKKLASFTLAAALVLSLCTNLGGGFVQVAQATGFVLDLEAINPDGDTGYTVENNVITVTDAGPVTITGDGTNNGDGWSIVVQNARNITIEGGTTILGAEGHSALTVPSGAMINGEGDDISITAWGDSFVACGITAGSGGLTISGTLGDIHAADVGIYTGFLTIDGTIGDVTGISNAGIYVMENITIADSGVVGNITGTARGIFSDRGNIEIRGTVGSITSNSNNIRTNSGNIEISGTVGVISENIHAGGTFTISNNSIVYASRVNIDPAPGSQGILFLGDIGTVYGDVELQEDLTLTEGQILTVPFGSSLIKGSYDVVDGTVANAIDLDNIDPDDPNVDPGTNIITYSSEDPVFIKGYMHGGEGWSIIVENALQIYIADRTYILGAENRSALTVPDGATITGLGRFINIIANGDEDNAHGIDSAGDFKIDSGGIIRASSVSKAPAAGSRGILSAGNEVTVCGNVTLQENFAVGGDQTLTVRNGASLTIPEGMQLHNDGTIVNNGTIANNGEIRNNGRIDSNNGDVTGRGKFDGNSIEFPIFFFPQPTAPEPLQAVHTFEHGTITLSDDVLAMLEELGGEVRIVLERVELDGLLAAVTKGYELVVNIAVFVDDVKVDVPLTVSLPYTLKDGENPAAVRVWYMDDGGTLTDLKGVFDEETGLITFDITHQSYFVVGYDEALAAWDGRWTDVEENEYFEAIAFIAWYLTELEETLFAGTGGGLFAPDMMMTRGQFMTVLHKLANRPEHVDGDGFDDVAEDAWYYDAVLWGFETGIVAGVGGNLFAPDDELSREQMAVILSKYAVYAGLELAELRELPEELEFSDWADEDGYITGLAGAGLLTSGGLDLTKGAPRAEIALMFMEFVRFIIGG